MIENKIIGIEDIIKYAKAQGYNSAKKLLTYKGEVVYVGTFEEFTTCGFPLLMTIRNNKIYEYDRSEIIDIMAADI